MSNDCGCEEMDGCCKSISICDSLTDFDSCNKLSNICYWDNDCGCDECCVNIVDPTDTEDAINCNKYSSNHLQCKKNKDECKWICSGKIPDGLVPAPTTTTFEPIQCCHYNVEFTATRTIACDDLSADECVLKPNECYMSCDGPQNIERTPSVLTQRVLIGKTAFTGIRNENDDINVQDEIGRDPNIEPSLEEIIEFETAQSVDVESGYVFQEDFDKESLQLLLQRLKNMDEQLAEGSRLFTANDNETEPEDNSTFGIAGAAELGRRRMFGPDGRWRVISSATSWPYRATGLITYGSSCRGCTGVLVGPRHVLTAGHCVHSGGSGGDWYNGSKMRFRPRTINKADCHSRPGFEVSYMWSVTGWTKKKRDWVDYGMIVLKKKPNYWMSFGWKWPMPISWTFHSNGYPGDKPPAQMWHTHCKFTARYIYTFRSKDCDFRSGTSGSGLYKWRSGNPVNYAIHKGRTSTRNYHVRITKSRFNRFCDWINTAAVC